MEQFILKEFDTLTVNDQRIEMSKNCAKSEHIDAKKLYFFPSQKVNRKHLLSCKNIVLLIDMIANCRGAQL